MKTKFKHIWLFILFLTLGSSIAEETEKNIYVVPIQDTIDLGIPSFVKRAIDMAESDNSELIIFDIDTFGGRVDAATQIKDAISATDITTIAFINRRAISAGSLISLSCDQIYMTDGGTIGATSVVDMSGSKQSEKSQSYMREEMAATAEKSGKNTDIARGMVDEELSFEFLVINGDSLKVDDIEGRKEGKLITLTTELALKYNIADGKSETVEELLSNLGIENYNIITLSDEPFEDENGNEDSSNHSNEEPVTSRLSNGLPPQYPNRAGKILGNKLKSSNNFVPDYQNYNGSQEPTPNLVTNGVTKNDHSVSSSVPRRQKRRSKRSVNEKYSVDSDIEHRML